MKRLFLKSIKKKQKIIIFYIDSEGQVTQRYIRVLQLYDDYILTYCFYRMEVRKFKFKNILSAGLIQKKKGA